MRCKTRGSPRVPGGPRVGLARCGKIQASNSGADHGPGRGVVAGFGALVRIRQWPHGKTSRRPVAANYFRYYKRLGAIVTLATS